MKDVLIIHLPTFVAIYGGLHCVNDMFLASGFPFQSGFWAPVAEFVPEMWAFEWNARNSTKKIALWYKIYRFFILKSDLIRVSKQ